MRAGPALRLTRAAVFAAVCVAVSGLGHALQSDTPLPWPALVLALIAAGVAGWWPAGRERGAPTVVGASAAGQVTLHALFSWTHVLVPGAGAGRPMDMPGTGRSDTAAHAHSGMTEGPTDLLALVLAFDGHSLTSGMALAHLVAGLLCGWWLWRGEAAVGQLGRSLALFVCAPLRRAWRVLSGAMTPPPRTRTAALHRRHRRPRRLVVLHGISRRGPPFVPSFD
ncbi:hypothetical protein [Streptomyces lushanensis]|uniref:hypothetical protein n=1 Tax=Streptomyces lushanensis TaxID=1434255 RepID=UPI000831BB08|nr:hypothetical protein [Streptomyces lushanensis]